LRCSCPSCPWLWSHQSTSDVPGCGAIRPRSRGVNTLNHTSLANTQPAAKCCAVSCS
jgi:hypothetical protein